MTKRIYFCIAALCIITLFSCGNFKEVTFSGIESVKIIQLSQQGVEAEISARIKNPNAAAFTIYPSDIDVTLNEMSAGKAQLTDNVKVKAKSEQAYTFKIKSNFSNLSLNDLPKLFAIAMSKNVKVKLTGNLNVGKLFVKKSYPVEVNQTVALGGL